MTKLPKQIKTNLSVLKDTLYNARTYAKRHPDPENNFSERIFTAALESLDIVSRYITELKEDNEKLQKENEELLKYTAQSRDILRRGYP